MMRIARYEKRLFAYLFDFILATAGAVAIFFLVPMNIGTVLKILLSQVVAALIYALMTGLQLWIFNGYTLGSSFVRIHAVRIDEKRMNLKTALLRSITLCIFAWAVVNAIYMLVVHTERTLFDRLSDTLVIDKKCY